jgi:hypothetical protein
MTSAVPLRSFRRFGNVGVRTGERAAGVKEGEETEKKKERTGVAMCPCGSESLAKMIACWNRLPQSMAKFLGLICLERKAMCENKM